ncbi:MULTISPECIES: hypothetical protein [Paraburkholderia]
MRASEAIHLSQSAIARSVIELEKASDSHSSSARPEE